jgi:hypothetical protein
MSLNHKSMAAAASLLLLGSMASAGEAGEPAERASLSVTAALGAAGVRLVAPGNVYQMRLEVFDDTDSKVYDSDFRFGNVLDWRLDEAEAAVFGDTYLCVVTFRDVSGRLGKRWGVLARDGGAPRWLAPAEAGRSAGERELLAVAGEVSDLVAVSHPGAGLTTALLAHDGRSGLLASGSGGLAFRLGDYLAGQDVERMRLTEQGNVGIGVKNPQARLDVAGVIHTSEGIRFPDGTLQTTAAADGERRGGTQRLTPVTEALVDGTGTPGVLAKWTTSANIGDSTIAEVGGNVGIGTTSPGGAFDLQRASSADLLQRFWNTGTGGAKLRYVAANGATSQVQFVDLDETIAAVAANQTSGLQFRVATSGTNDEAALANSARMTITRNGDVGIGVTNPVFDLEIEGGSGVFGDATYVQIGGLGANGDFKGINFGDYLPTGSGVSIGESEEDNQMVLLAQKYRLDGGHVFPGSDATQDLGTTDNRWRTVYAFNGVVNTSDARQKQAVTNLTYGLREILQLRPVSFEWKQRPDGRQHLGLIAQEVRTVVPEAVVASSDPDATLGMSYAELLPVVIRAIQEQQGNIAALGAENAALRAQIAALQQSAKGSPH